MTHCRGPSFPLITKHVNSEVCGLAEQSVRQESLVIACLNVTSKGKVVRVHIMKMMYAK
jgi:hypothetical protein